ncbi:hypothetical protein BJY04DRAFT_216960 [Aspergillus karnatakaensis]|uniref:DUF3431 domain-containing protein n=1 Tax=Aspergillus karnatakaensis TaxID=1810916 RepID=UPI003CCDF92C
MHRKTRRTAVHLAFFLTIFALLILCNRPPSEKRSFPWTRIRYKSPSSASQSRSHSTKPSTPFPDEYGICPGLTPSLQKPILVVSHIASDGDTTWLTNSDLAQKYHLCIYNVDDPIPTSFSSKTNLRVPANRAHESITYLTFLISNYHALPPTGVTFVHGSRFAWHNDSPDYDNAALLSDLDIHSAIAETGYHNLRCDWSVGTCGSDALPQGSLQVGFQAKIAPWDGRVVSDWGLSGALGSVFGLSSRGRGGRVLGRHDVLRAQCCAQFVVSRDAIYRHGREEYVALREWLLDGSDSSTATSGLNRNSRILTQAGFSPAAPKDDKVAGRMMSYMWHILFLDARADGSEEEVDLEKLNRLACPTARECYCRLYGRCGLERCRGGSCGVYRVPVGYKVPKGILEKAEGVVGVAEGDLK